MLSSLKQTHVRTIGRSALVLAILAIAGLAIAKLRPVTENSFAGQADKSKPVAIAQRDSPASRSATATGFQAREAATVEVDEYFPRPTAAERTVFDALEKPVDVEFNNAALSECLETLRSQSKIDILLDIGRVGEEGVSLDQPITLKLKGRRLQSVLNLLLRPIQLEYIYEDEVLKITTATSASETLLTRTYPIGDLCPELKEETARPEQKQVSSESNDPRIRVALLQGFGGGGGMGGGGGGAGGGGKPTRFTNLINAIETTVQPDSWEGLSGPGSVIAVAAAHSLVIRQTRSVHREVLQLLRDLRAAKRMPQPASGRAVRVEEVHEGERSGGGFF